MTLAADRRSAQRISFTERLWSGDAAWSGFPIERHRLGPEGGLHDFAVPDIVIGLCVGGSAQVEWRTGARTWRAIAGPGSFTLLVAGDRQPSITWSGTREMIFVRIEAAQLHRYFPDRAAASGDAGLAPQYWISDPHVARLVACMHDEVLTGCPGGAVYAQSLSLALSSYLFNRFSERSATPPEAGGTAFTTPVARRLIDYVHGHLGQDIRLVDLAGVAGLSPHYFLEKFKCTFGTTPHHYLLAERIDEAKRLLKDDHGSIGEIGRDLGFSDQSHFTATFRRLTGTTPRRFRSTLRT